MVCGQHCLGSKAWGLESPFYNGSWSMAEPTMCSSRWELGAGLFSSSGVGSFSGTHVTCSCLHGSQMIQGKGFSSSSPVLEMRCWALGANVTPRLCLKPNPAGPQLPYSFISQQQPLGGRGKQHSLWTEGRIIFRNHVAKCWWNRKDPKKLKIHNRTELIGFTLTFITSTFEFSPYHLCAA